MSEEILAEPINAGFDDIPKNTPTYGSYIAALNIQKKRTQLYGASSLPSSVIHYGGPKFNQWLKSETKAACGMFAICNGIAVRNTIQGTFGVISKETPDPYSGWIELCQKYGASPTKGSSMTQNLNWATTHQYIQAWFIAKGILEMKTAISEKEMIFVGTDRADWAKMKKNGFMFVPTKDKVEGHLQVCIGYDDNKVLNGKKGFFVILDNGGPTKWNDGYYYVQYDDYFKYWYTPVVMLDFPADADVAKVIEETEALDTARKMGIWNGKRPKDKVTYYEAAIMIVRGLLGHGKTNDEDTLKIASAMGVLPTNIKGEETAIWRGDMVSMVMRGFYRDRSCTIKNDLLVIAKNAGLWNGQSAMAYATREQCVIVIMRAINLRKLGTI